MKPLHRTGSAQGLRGNPQGCPRSAPYRGVALGLRLFAAACLPACVIPFAATVAVLPAFAAESASPKDIERQLQALPWEQFRAVIESEPKLKADVDKYGPLGWAFVRGRYQTHPWAENIERLDASRRHQLVAAIRKARHGVPGVAQAQSQPPAPEPVVPPAAPAKATPASPMDGVSGATAVYPTHGEHGGEHAAPDAGTLPSGQGTEPPPAPAAPAPATHTNP